MISLMLLSGMLSLLNTEAFVTRSCRQEIFPIPMPTLPSLFWAPSRFSTEFAPKYFARQTRSVWFASTSSDFSLNEAFEKKCDINIDDFGALTEIEPAVLKGISTSASAAHQWGEMFGFPNSAEVVFYALFSSIRNNVAMGLKGNPFHLKHGDILKAMHMDESNNGNNGNNGNNAVSPLAGFFKMADLEKAVNEDFLDAQQGSTDNRKGWKVRAVSEAKGTSFQDAKMTFSHVNNALERGTVIFNAIGAHVPQLAGATLSCTDATSLPAAVNMYVTAPNKRTSAPPHTDRQDVVVVQTEGSKRWRVFKPTNPYHEPNADLFSRGKGDDNLPLYRLLEHKDNLLMLDVTLNEGDVLFIPAGFPHTTDTSLKEENNDKASIHLTFGLDTHVWDLDYLSLRRLALRKAGVADTALGQMRDEENRYVGACNLLPSSIHKDLFSSLPLGFLDEDNAGGQEISTKVSAELQRISHGIDSETALAAERVKPSIWEDTTNRIRTHGLEIFDVHRDMYLAAIEEGEIRAAEEKMSAHLNTELSYDPKPMTSERMQRLSLFRVKKFYDQVNDLKSNLISWSHDSLSNVEDHDSTEKSGDDGKTALPFNWEFTVPLKVGDNVDADLGGAFFPATVTKVVGDRFNVQFFDGDQMDGLERGAIKLLTPPKQEVGTLFDSVDISSLTKKELKRLRKKQEKLDRKKRK